MKLVHWIYSGGICALAALVVLVYSVHEDLYFIYHGAIVARKMQVNLRSICLHKLLFESCLEEP